MSAAAAFRKSLGAIRPFVVAGLLRAAPLGGSAIRQILLDPLLPAPIGDPEGLLALVEEMRDFDKLGRKLWSGWMGEAGAQPLSGPADVRELRGLA